MDDTLLIVTGASRGLGRAIGVAFASSPSTEHLFCLLVARSESGLEETASLMREAAAAAANNSKLDISCMVADLSDMDTLEKKVEEMFEQATKKGKFTYDRAILINNAGSLGYLGKCSEITSLANLKKQSISMLHPRVGYRRSLCASFHRHHHPRTEKALAL